MSRSIVRVVISIFFLVISFTPVSATKEVNCGGAKVNKSGEITNFLCSNGSPNLGVKVRLTIDSPNIMKLTRKSLNVLRLQNALCSDFKRAEILGLNTKNIRNAFVYQFSKLDLKGVDTYKAMTLIIVTEEYLTKFVSVRCIDGKFIEDQSAASALKIAQELVDKNTKLQDSCYFTRTTNGENPTYARNFCAATYPNNLQWALSSNHKSEENCFNTQVFNGTNPIDARSNCLARFPIRN